MIIDTSAAFILVPNPYNLVLQLYVQTIAAAADAADVIMLGIPVNKN